MTATRRRKTARNRQAAARRESRKPRGGARSSRSRPPRIWDISRPIGERTPAWPGDVPFTWRAVESLADGSLCESTAFTMSAHLGTHADAPCHVLSDGAAIGQAPLEAYVGPARVVELPGRGEIGPDSLPPRSLAKLRILFRSRGRAFLSPLAAVRLAERGVLLVGTDAASIDPPDAPDLPAHRALLSRGVALLENLDLAAVEPGDYRLVALPLRFEDLDASPVRAILLPR